MASLSPWRWRWKATSDSAINFSPSCSSFNSSTTFSPCLILRKRSLLITFLLDPSSSSSSSPSTSTSVPNNARKRWTKSANPIAFPDESKYEVSPNPNHSQKTLTLSFKSLFGRRSLWRRILFASRKVRSIILLNVITVIYASNIPVLKEVEATMDPATFTVVRFIMSAIPFLPFVLRARGDIKTRNAGIELGLWVSLGYLMQALGLLTSDAGRASFISLFTVIVVPLLDGMLGTIIPARTWFGALTSVVGVAMLESSGSPPSVCVVALLSTMWYFIGGWFGGIQECDQSSWTLIMFWDWMVAFPWIPALYTGIFSTGLCLWIEMAAMRDVSATETAIIYGLEPVWGASFAWFLLGERWGITGWIGATLVLVGSLTVQIYGSSSPSLSQEGEHGEKGDDLLVSDKQNGFSSPFVVSSEKDKDGP